MMTAKIFVNLHVKDLKRSMRSGSAGEIKGTTGNAYYARIEKRHPILGGFEGTSRISGDHYRLPPGRTSPSP